MPELLREHDPNVLLAVQAANVAAAEMYEQQAKRHAEWVIHKFSEAWKG